MSFPANHIAQVRKKRKLSQQQLADAVGAHSITISNLERGKSNLSHEWVERIADALKVDPSALLAAESPVRVYLDGWIENHGHLRLAIDGYPIDVKLGFAEVLAASWVLVFDETLYPVLNKGDLVRLVTIDDEDPKDLAGCLGRLSFLQTVDKPDEVHLGYLALGSEPGTFSLTRIGRPPIANAKIKSLHVVDRAYFQPALPEELAKLIEDHRAEQ